PGAQVQPSAYNDDPVLGAMLPAKLLPRQQPGSDGRSLAWQTRGYTHPVTSLWNDSTAGSLGTVRATAWFPLKLPPPPKDKSKPASLVIVKYTDGSPAAVETSYGAGKVVLFSTAATTDGNNLPIHPNFVPLLQRLVGYLSPDKNAQSLTLTPGAVFQGRVPGDLVTREVSVISPGSNGKPRAAGKVELSNQDAVVRYRDTAKTGPYRFTVAGVDKPVAAFAVQMDAKESDLRMADASKLATLNTPASATSGTAQTVAAEPVKVRREFWTFFIWFALIVALIEMTLAHRFSFAK
ncbi:MAG: hypothetical protein ACREKL_13550, partial [Chthoniobacterales bacterium]